MGAERVNERDVSPRFKLHFCGAGTGVLLINDSRDDFFLFILKSKYNFETKHHIESNMSSSNGLITPATLFKIAAALNLVRE